MPGVFNVDPGAAAASLRRQAELDAEIACFGHGAPLTDAAAPALRTAAGGRRSQRADPRLWPSDDASPMGGRA
jgi:hypothetical protein